MREEFAGTSLTYSTRKSIDVKLTSFTASLAVNTRRRCDSLFQSKRVVPPAAWLGG